MRVMIASVFLALVAHSACSFTVGGTTYDLSSLNGQVAEGPDKKVSTYQYKAAVCSNMTVECQDIMTGKTLSGAVYEYGGGSSPGSKTVCWDILAFWDESNVQSEALDTSTDGVPAGATGVALKLSNGDECRNAPRKTTMNMICDGSAGTPGTLEGFQDATDSCHFIINWKTKDACNGHPTTTTSTAPPQPKWGVNGTFQGDLECLAATNECTLKTTDNQLRGNCDNMKLVTVTGGKYEVWEMEFAECGGYYFSGTMTGANSGQKFKMHGSYSTSTNKLEIQLVDSNFPFQAMYKLTMDKVDDNRRRWT